MTLQEAALIALLRLDRWADTREVLAGVLAIRGLDQHVTTTTVSVALQRLHRRARIGKGPHPASLRLVRWHHDPTHNDRRCPLCLAKGTGHPADRAVAR